MYVLPILSTDSGMPLFEQLYRHLAAEITAGRLPSGTKLPSIRRLAADLRVSRTPVELAYAQLLAEGYVRSKPRSGVFVALQRDGLEPAARGREARASAGGEGAAGHAAGHRRDGRADGVGDACGEGDAAIAHGRAGGEGVAGGATDAAGHRRDGHVGGPPDNAAMAHETTARPNGPAPVPVRLDFGYGGVDLLHFPFLKWKRLYNRCFLPDNRHLFLYGDVQGERGLREQIAAYLYQVRGVDCSPEQIVVGAGTYHSLDLLLQLLPDRFAAVALEEAVNDGVKALFLRRRLQLHPVSLEPDGVSIDELAASPADIVYVTPSHQFPYGMIMPYGKRLQLLQWAEQRDGLIIENDYDAEFRHDGRPIPALHGLEGGKRVLYVGTFSRALTPSFRVSYLVLPPPLLDRFRRGLHSYDQLASPFHQKTLELFMESGDFERYMRRMRTLYRHKRDVLLKAVGSHMNGRARVIGAESGLHVLLQVPAGPSEAELVGRAAMHGVRVYSASTYRLRDKPEEPATVLLGFGGLSEDEIQEGIRLLRDAWFGA